MGAEGYYRKDSRADLELELTHEAGIDESTLPQCSYHSAHSRARIVVVLLIVGGALSFLSIPIRILEISFGQPAPGEEFSDNPGAFGRTITEWCVLAPGVRRVCRYGCRFPDLAVSRV